jgi:hypothetical protein
VRFHGHDDGGELYPDLDADVHHLEHLLRYQHPGPPDYTVTMTQGQAYTCPQELGGNQFVGTVNIPKSGKQAITNLWTQGQNIDARATLIIRSFSYTHQIRSRT